MRKTIKKPAKPKLSKGARAILRFVDTQLYTARERWCKGRFGDEYEATEPHCLVGALRCAAYHLRASGNKLNDSDFRDAQSALLVAGNMQNGVVAWNDAGSRSFAMVKRVLRKARGLPRI